LRNTSTTERLVGIGDPIPTFVVTRDGGTVSQLKTVLEILDRPETREDIKRLFDDIEGRYWEKGRKTVTIQDGANLTDDPKVKPLVDETKVYVVET